MTNSIKLNVIFSINYRDFSMKKQNQKSANATSEEIIENTIEISEDEIEFDASETDESRSKTDLETENQKESAKSIELKKNGVPGLVPNLLVNKIYRLKQEILSLERKLENNKKLIEKWQIEDEEKLKAINEKFEKDKVTKIIEYRESGCLEGKNILIDYYQKQIEKLLAEKEEQENTGNKGDFTDLYKEYLNNRTLKYEKQISRLHKYYIDVTAEKRDIAIPKLEATINTLNLELQKSEHEAKEYQKA